VKYTTDHDGGVLPHVSSYSDTSDVVDFLFGLELEQVNLLRSDFNGESINVF
jgi:hypothetical protein